MHPGCTFSSIQASAGSLRAGPVREGAGGSLFDMRRCLTRRRGPQGTRRILHVLRTYPPGPGLLKLTNVYSLLVCTHPAFSKRASRSSARRRRTDGRTDDRTGGRTGRTRCPAPSAPVSSSADGRTEMTRCPAPSAPASSSVESQFQAAGCITSSRANAT